MNERNPIPVCLSHLGQVLPLKAAWQPMETAPKDRPILLYCPEAVQIPKQTYCWPRLTMMHILMGHWHEPDGQTGDGAGWYAPFTEFYGGVYDDPSCDFDSVDLTPTHWMPLPDPPA